MIKPHRTLRVTRKLLQTELRACPPGLDAVRDFLPVTLSTDPVENLEIAERLLEANQDYRVWWLVQEANYYKKGRNNSILYNVAWLDHVDDGDPYVTAQLLAMFADTMLSARGL